MPRGPSSATKRRPNCCARKKPPRKVGTAIEFIEDITSSSSHLINNYLGLFSDDVAEYLARFKATYSADDILAAVAARPRT